LGPGISNVYLQGEKIYMEFPGENMGLKHPSSQNKSLKIENDDTNLPLNKLIMSCLIINFMFRGDKAYELN
jgi:hypothetical protein